MALRRHFSRVARVVAHAKWTAKKGAPRFVGCGLGLATFCGGWGTLDSRGLLLARPPLVLFCAAKGAASYGTSWLLEDVSQSGMFQGPFLMLPMRKPGVQKLCFCSTRCMFRNDTGPPVTFGP